MCILHTYYMIYYTETLGNAASCHGRADPSSLDTLQRGVQWMGDAVEWGSII